MLKGKCDETTSNHFWTAACARTTRWLSVLPCSRPWLTSLLLAHSFSINLGSSSSDLALHFNPRFTETVIVCNSRCGNAWQAEHRDHHFCFSRDSTVKVRALWGCWGVFVGGKTQVSRLLYPLCLPLPHPLGFGSWLLFPLLLQFPNLSLSSCALTAPRSTLTIRPPSPPAGDAAPAAL